MNPIAAPKRMFLFSLLFFYVTFCGCDPAQSKTVPGGFSQENFQEIVDYASDHFLDSRNVSTTRAYVGAGEAALLSLPSPVYLMTRAFYEARPRLQKADRIVPGRVVEINKQAPYILLVPDYVKWDKQNKAYLNRERERLRKMSRAERNAREEAVRKRSREMEAFTEKAWSESGFGARDFERIIAWIRDNREEYFKLPPSHTGDDPYKTDPFGMHHVFFAAANGFLHSMDPHSGVIDRESWEKIKQESQDASFEGIGAMLRGGGIQDVVVETPLPGSPALRAGLRSGDIIRKVDDQTIEKLPLSAVVKKIRGTKDTVVALTVERPLEAYAVLTIKIKRAKIELKSVSSRFLPEEKVGVIKISSFLHAGVAPSTLIRREFQSLMNEADGDLRGVVLDLRNNPGGFLDDAIRVAGLFLPNRRVVVHIKGRGRGLEPKYAGGDPIVRGVPIIVLINAGSASASEIVASALMDHGVGLVLGERSFGKATVQGMHTRGDIYIKLTTARYYAPRGYTVQVHGVKPDIQISDERDGSFPVRFREEDMWKHFPELEDRDPDPRRAAWVTRLQTVVGENKAAEAYIEEHKNDALRTDYMLRRALAYMQALRQYPKP